MIDWSEEPDTAECWTESQLKTWEYYESLVNRNMNASEADRRSEYNESEDDNASTINLEIYGDKQGEFTADEGRATDSEVGGDKKRKRKDKATDGTKKQTKRLTKAQRERIRRAEARAARAAEGPGPSSEGEARGRTDQRDTREMSGSDMPRASDYAESQRAARLLALVNEDGTTTQGRDREAHRQRIAELEKQNPAPVNAKKNTPNQAPDTHTFEVTKLDYTPVGNDFMKAATLLSEEKRRQDARFENDQIPKILKINSRSIRTGDWLVWAEDDYTLCWLKEFFAYEGFAQQFRATLIADRGQLVKYKIKVQAPESLKSKEELAEYIFRGVPPLGYVRFADESRRYKNQEVNEAYYKAQKKKVDFDRHERALR